MGTGGRGTLTMFDLLFGDGQVVVEEVQQLLLHQVHLCLREQVRIPTLEGSKKAKPIGKGRR